MQKRDFIQRCVIRAMNASTEDAIIQAERHWEALTQAGYGGKKTKPGTARFKKPTVAEIALYCKERGNGINSQAFYDSNEAKGWVVGKTQTPMKDWRAAVRTWENGNKEQEKKKVKMAASHKPYNKDNGEYMTAQALHADLRHFEKQLEMAKEAESGTLITQIQAEIEKTRDKMESTRSKSIK